MPVKALASASSELGNQCIEDAASSVNHATALSCDVAPISLGAFCPRGTVRTARHHGVPLERLPINVTATGVLATVLTVAGVLETVDDVVGDPTPPGSILWLSD